MPSPRIPMTSASRWDDERVRPAEHHPIAHSNWSALTIADVTMDGHPDIAGAPGFVIAGHGDGTFEEPAWFAFEGVGMHVADFNRDGLPDLITAVTTARSR